MKPNPHNQDKPALAGDVKQPHDKATPKWRETSMGQIGSVVVVVAIAAVLAFSIKAFGQQDSAHVVPPGWPRLPAPQG